MFRSFHTPLSLTWTADLFAHVSIHIWMLAPLKWQVVIERVILLLPILTQRYFV